MGRIAGGVRAIKLEGDDEVVAMELVEQGSGSCLLSPENGYGKRTKVEDYKIQVRGGKGLLTYDKGEVRKDRSSWSVRWLSTRMTMFC